jgi:hypothetical protein
MKPQSPPPNKSYFCGSWRCLTLHKAAKNQTYVMKDISPQHSKWGNTIECPDCGSIMLFRRKGTAEPNVTRRNREQSF